MRPSRLSILGLMAIVVLIAMGLVALRFSTPNIAGTVILFTLFVLALAILAAVNRRDSHRAFWIGFALMGWWYVLFSCGSWTLTYGEIEHRVVGEQGGEFENPHQEPILAHWLPTTALLDGLGPAVQANSGSDASLNRVASLFGFADTRTMSILEALRHPVRMPFGEETSLGDVLKHVKESTRSRSLPEGIPIYIDPVGLQEAEKTMDSSISNIELNGVPLKNALSLILQQLELKYSVSEGLLTITSTTRDLPYNAEAVQSFRRVGHCLFALAFALIGGFAGRILFATRPAGNAGSDGR